ncbi:helix-turn-helix domain-containing protein [Achromobacter pestifer]|uniref:HTH-type transcriptional activator RhaR n=1 Tax=Achromobacter pestifer TaxID=1353889 RepID=A0A6S6YKK8_9BURK|nr:AraC family transcriptional regulator [Achromobacter pestifer]CAB3628771.1 HTH-type transcriptional activator RhaR [Achromobacter pestifer]
MPQRLQIQASDITVTRMRSQRDDLPPGPPIPAQDAFSVIVQLQDFRSHTLWRGNRVAYQGGHAQGALAITHLGDEWRCDHRSPFDNIRFHLPRGVLDAFSTETSRARVSGFDCRNGTQDPVIYNLACALVPALTQPQQASRLFVDQISLALQTHVMHRYGRVSEPAIDAGSHLSPWQLRRATELLAANIGGDLSIADIATECGLSRSYFIKAFKGSTGKTPHRWLTAHRIERACALLTQSHLPIAAVALACGFADQSHLTRVFTQVLGTTPGMWRR